MVQLIDLYNTKKALEAKSRVESMITQAQFMPMADSESKQSIVSELREQKQEIRDRIHSESPEEFEELQTERVKQKEKEFLATWGGIDPNSLGDD